MSAPWLAPTASGPVDATVTVPGSKSIANRAVVLAALADGPGTVAGLPRGARDLTLMLTALRTLGTDIADLSDTAVRITPGHTRDDVSVNCGLAGTVMRFVPPVAALGATAVSFDGDPRARQRPMGPFLRALRELGIAVSDGDRLPFTVHGTGSVPGGGVTVDASASSQFISALLLTGARFTGGVDVRHRGGPVPSLPHIALTVAMLRDHGVRVDEVATDRRRAEWRVHPGPVTAHDRVVEPDLSNAAPFVALAVVTGGRCLVRDWPAQSRQPPLIPLFEQFGATFRPTAEGMLVSGPDSIRPLTADLRDLGELVPTVTAVCAFASGPSRLSGVGHIAGHETDRLAALAAGFRGLGGRVDSDDDGLTITPQRLHGGAWPTHHDHRMATCGAIVGARVPGVLVADVATTAKTFPGFADTWSAAVAGTAP